MAYSNAENFMRVGMPAELAKVVGAAIEDGPGPVQSVNGDTGVVVLVAADVGAVAVPDTPAAYSIDPEDLAAVLVAAGLMEEDAP